jgi:hypothetical protein
MKVLCKRAVLLTLALFGFAARPVSMAAQNDKEHKSDVLIRLQGPITVAKGDSIGTLVVVANDATILGTVGDLVVINGFAQLSGTVTGNVTLINGSGRLASGAIVKKDMLLYRSTMEREKGAIIGGLLHDEGGVSFRARALWLIWLSVTLAMIVAGLVFGYFAGPSLDKVADFMRADWPGILITTLFIVCGLPLLAVLSFMTGIGFVVGFFILFVLIPMLSLVGYIVAGTALGRALLGDRDTTRGKFGAIALGILIMQMLAVIPALGGIIAIVCSQLGAAALVSDSWRRRNPVKVQPDVVLQPA